MDQKKQGVSYTINDIVKDTGLSRSTVSRVINESENVSDISRNTVLAAIERLGYVPNMIARGLRTSLKTIGVVVQDILNPYYIEALYEIEKICKNHGYTVLYMNSDNDPRVESSNLYHLLGMKVQGIILLANLLDETDKIVRLAMQETRLITMEGQIEGVDSVLSNPIDGVPAMVDKLVQLGHKSFGLAYHSVESFPLKEREKVFLDKLKSYNLEVKKDHFFYGSLYIEQLGTALEGKDFPTAIFCLNDNTAFYLYGWCKEKGISVPQELSIVGFDDVSAYRMMMPTLTTVHQPIGLLAETATNILIGDIESNGKNYKSTPPQTVRIETQFIQRESIGVPRQGNIER